VIRYLSDEHHERLWRICDALVSGSGARSALLCDEANGAVIVSVGDASARGSVSEVHRLSPQEFAVEGEGGQIYGINIPGGAMLVVLHDAGALEHVRAVAADAVHDVAELLASLPPPPPPPAHDHSHPHPHTTATDTATATTTTTTTATATATTTKTATATTTATATQRRATKSKPAPKKPAKQTRKKSAPKKKKGSTRKVKPSSKRRR
jgi:hypothetical protein